jgi:ParB-like chromosome segregation protein Spo0J
MEPEWSNRIVGYEPEVEPDQLTAHPLNARRHPGRQRDALRESLGRVGWVDVVKVNTVTGNVVDGHARVEEALTKGGTVPVLYVELEPDEERFVLATLDPISAMAEYDAEVLEQLLEGLTIDTQALVDLLGDQRALAEGAPPLDDLADEYDPTTAGVGGGGGGLVLEVPELLVDRWREHRRGFTTDAEAFELLLP